jgi:hypothetical protein
MEDAVKREILGYIAPAATALALVAFTASTAQNAEKEHPRAGSQAGGEVQPMALGGLVAPGARLAAFVNAGGGPIRTKGVDSIVRIDTGVYCIRPTAGSGIDVAKSLVIVSPEFFNSIADEVSVQWAAQGSGCGSARFGIYTLIDSNHDANYSFSNGVAFSIYVP